MVLGDHLLDNWVSGTVATTDGTTTPLCSITVTNSTGPLWSQMRIEGWVIGREVDFTAHKWYQEVATTATVDDDTTILSATSETTIVTHDPDTSGWTGIEITANSTDIILNITGAASTNIRWYGELKVKQIENPDLSFGGA